MAQHLFYTWAGLNVANVAAGNAYSVPPPGWGLYSIGEYIKV
jgi:hypothetical protein